MKVISVETDGDFILMNQENSLPEVDKSRVATFVILGTTSIFIILKKKKELIGGMNHLKLRPINEVLSGKNTSDETKIIIRRSLKWMKKYLS